MDRLLTSESLTSRMSLWLSFGSRVGLAMRKGLWGSRKGWNHGPDFFVFLSDVQPVLADILVRDSRSLIYFSKIGDLLSILCRKRPEAPFCSVLIDVLLPVPIDIYDLSLAK